MEGLQAGADDYLIKPFSARELLARVESSLELSAFGARPSRHRAGAAPSSRPSSTRPAGRVSGRRRLPRARGEPIARLAFGDIPGGLIGRDFDEVITPRGRSPTRTRSFASSDGRWRPVSRHHAGACGGSAGPGHHRVLRVAGGPHPLADGRSGVVCYFRDISAQVLARHAIEESREALREADRRKDEFLATLAHELRNPLAPMRNGLQLMKLAQGDAEGIERARMMSSGSSDRWCG